MKQVLFSMLMAVMILVTSCKTSKGASEALYSSTWELEYLSGPRIAFNGLYPNKKPHITFHKETQQVTGSNSCNGYSAPYTLSGHSLSFGEPGPTTMMFCGEGEGYFLKTMQMIDAYSIDADGTLNLSANGVTMMHFKATKL